MKPMFRPAIGRNSSGRGAVWLARLNGVQEVGGSNPLAPTYKACRNNKLRQAFFIEFRRYHILWGEASRGADDLSALKLVREDHSIQRICMGRGPDHRRALAESPIFPCCRGALAKFLSIPALSQRTAPGGPTTRLKKSLLATINTFFILLALLPGWTAIW
jgi:hypothetical protein